MPPALLSGFPSRLTLSRDIRSKLLTAAGVPRNPPHSPSFPIGWVIVYLTSPPLEERTLRYLHFSGLRAPPLPPPIVATCQGFVHAFNSKDLLNFYLTEGPSSLIFACKQQPCPNCTPRSIDQDYECYKAIRRVQHPLSPCSTHASRSTSRHSRAVSLSSRLPQTVASTSQEGGDPDLPPNPTPESEPDESASEEGVSEPELTLHGWAASPDVLPAAPPVPVVRDAPSGLPPSLYCRLHREAARARAPLEVRPADSHNHRLCPRAVLHPPPPIMSSPASPLDKETLKHLLSLRYDGKTVIECDRFLSQLRVYHKTYKPTL
ncbi:hypothetical protein IEO21_07743 [Rhodonia placenta]|uniref:Uncharacterized protein n=1 Tax=Rhodonia placenta TaxID=104341 RepID=A0A8H7NXG2_9APHY|nr:hypothetical protein IEO21_07743 [Postia placenta]